MSSSEPKPWDSIINQSVHTSDDHDLGSAHAVSRHFLVVKRGIVHVHYYYIPVNKVEGWDGRVLWLKVTQDVAKHSYERDRTPKSSTYYMGEHPDFAYLPASEFSFPSPLPLIPLKVAKSEKEIKVPSGDIPHVYACPLCNEILQTEDEFGSHVEAVH
jgi:hypothetical protein